MISDPLKNQKCSYKEKIFIIINKFMERLNLYFIEIILLNNKYLIKFNNSTIL